ncbi:GNAT family N-acetyltransferase [Streptomyces sp. NBC_00467]|uniref:GNAT family N-acetyltransferase n=1 Tax=Streptomyces sp. NBC_00467 TaxID=2975752 RepID=UPI002E174CB0
MSESEHRVVVEGSRILTPRLILRPWEREDAEPALSVYGSDDVARWLAPAVERVPDAQTMLAHIDHWIADSETREPPQGRWAVVLRETGELVGGVALLPLPPYDVDLEIAWQLAPDAWGKGLAAEAGHGVAHHAFASGIDELFAVVRPNNARGAATARRVGMAWVGETEKYYDLRLQVYRLRKADLDAPTQPYGI